MNASLLLRTRPLLGGEGPGDKVTITTYMYQPYTIPHLVTSVAGAVKREEVVENRESEAVNTTVAAERAAAGKS